MNVKTVIIIVCLKDEVQPLNVIADVVRKSK